MLQAAWAPALPLRMELPWPMPLHSWHAAASSGRLTKHELVQELRKRGVAPGGVPGLATPDQMHSGGSGPSEWALRSAKAPAPAAAPRRTWRQIQGCPQDLM